MTFRINLFLALIERPTLLKKDPFLKIQVFLEETFTFTNLSTVAIEVLRFSDKSTPIEISF
jgi:hypothetical protein